MTRKVETRQAAGQQLFLFSDYFWKEKEGFINKPIFAFSCFRHCHLKGFFDSGGSAQWTSFFRFCSLIFSFNYVQKELKCNSYSGGKISSQIFVYWTVQFKKQWIIKMEKTTCVKIFCLFTDDYDLVKLSAGSCSVSVWEQIYFEGRVCGKMDCCNHSNRGNPPFAQSLSSFASLTKTLGLEGRGDRNPSAYYVAFHFFLLSLSCLGWKLCPRIFCSIWVGSKCLSMSRAEAPSRAAQFDLLVLKSQRDISVHLESKISQQRHSRYWIKTEINTLYICVNKESLCIFEISNLKTSHTFLLLLLLLLWLIFFLFFLQCHSFYLCQSS